MIEALSLVGLVISFFLSFLITKKLIEVGKKRGIVAEDLNKSSKPKVFHLGGIGLALSFFLSSMFVLGINLFYGNGIRVEYYLAIVLTGIVLAFVGLIDDLFGMKKWIKALFPMVASIPLITLKAVGSTTIAIPLLGPIDFGAIYLFLIIPLAISGTANLANIFAGINGIEASLSLVIYLTGMILGYYFEKNLLFIFSSIMVGALIGFLIFNKYPSKVFPGDVGTLLMGGVISTLAIVDNLESFVFFLFIPHLIDLVIKTKNKLPSEGWWFEEREGLLIPPKKPISLLQYTVKIMGKIKESELVLFYTFIEMMLGVLAILLLIAF